MNNVRSCFATTVAFLVVAIGWWAADAVVCCNNSSVASGGGGDVVPSCWNKGRQFHMVEAIGGGTCDDNRKALPVHKCCPLGQSYNPKERLCIPAVVYGDEHLRRMMQRLSDGSREVADASMVGYVYNYMELGCNDLYEQVDLPADELLMEASTLFDNMDGWCFDLAPSDELVARACKRHDEYDCSRHICVNKCCKGNWTVVDGPKGPQCKQSEKPFRMFTYSTDGGGSKVKVVPYYEHFECSHRDMVEYGFQLTKDGNLYLTNESELVPHSEYCLGYSQMTGIIVAMICNTDTVFVITRVRGRLIPLFYRATYVASAVCLALALLVYNTLPSLRNIRSYYVKCYMGHQFVTHICAIAQFSIENKRKGDSCVLFGYISLFVFLSTLCWLNVICFDIYWMMRHHISINRNISTSVRTIMYHFYCWGLPSIFVCIGLFFEYSQDEWLQQLSPHLEEYGCFYYHMSGYGVIIFILIPVFVLLTANLILFWLTANHSSRIKSEFNKFIRTDSNTESVLVYKEKFVTSIKLFLTMGIPYFLAVLSVILRIEGMKWYIIYAASSLQGVFIFIIFVAKRKVIMDLQKKLRGSLDHSESTQINTIPESS